MCFVPPSIAFLKYIKGHCWIEDTDYYLLTIKKIGKMTYIVRVHFSTTSKETFEDKVKRMLRNEVQQMMENE